MTTEGSYKDGLDINHFGQPIFFGAFNRHKWRAQTLTRFTILYDAPHEAAWFRALHPELRNASEQSITSAKSWPSVQRVLAYDRPDIVLLDGRAPILVVEETVEVPSGHNVGQRFARVAAAGEQRVPCLYFGPYVARKHGGNTAGPRYMNVRLFKALDAMVRLTGTAVTTINWPVDDQFEVRRDAHKDDDVRDYLNTFLAEYRKHGLEGINAAMLASATHNRMIAARDAFVRDEIRRVAQYDDPPNSVKILTRKDFAREHGTSLALLPSEVAQFVVYKIGMNNIRSDPYTGMALLYRYLYLAEHQKRHLVLWLPNIARAQWVAAAANQSRKDVRLYRLAADAILFADGLLLKGGL